MTNAIPLIFLLALAQVESGNDPAAVGDNGLAVGILQVRPIALRDVCRISGQSFTLSDRLSPYKSFQMARIYLGRYCSEKRLGRKPTWEDFGAAWNSGPAYRTKWHKTDAYRAKLRIELDRLGYFSPTSAKTGGR